MLKKTGLSAVSSYLEDSSNLSGGSADGIYLPQNENEVIELLKECSGNSLPLTISGGTTGTTGGCIPFGGWLLGTEKFDRIKEVNEKKKFAIIQPAVTLDRLETKLKKTGLFYPPDPTETTAFIGGNVATNASGSRSFKYGPTRDWIRRLRVVLTTGEVLDLSRNDKLQITKYTLPSYPMPLVKNAAGYFSKKDMPLIDLFIGSEGTLGVVTEIEVALVPRFYGTFDVVAFFPKEKDAVDFTDEARKKEALMIEFFDCNSLCLLRNSYSQVPAKAQAAVYIETGLKEDTGLSYLEEWGTLLQKHHADLDQAWMAMTEKQKEDIKKFRHAMPEHINEEFKRHKTVKFASDIAVPDQKFREMLKFYDDRLAEVKDKIFSVKFGHIGENHLHVNLVPMNEKDIPLAKELIMKFVRKGIALGGTCSAEHGIGKIKHAYLKEMYGDTGIAEMVKIKKQFDPAGILNQGNIFPRELLV